MNFRGIARKAANLAAGLCSMSFQYPKFGSWGVQRPVVYRWRPVRKGPPASDRGCRSSLCSGPRQCGARRCDHRGRGRSRGGRPARGTTTRLGGPVATAGELPHVRGLAFSVPPRPGLGSRNLRVARLRPCLHGQIHPYQGREGGRDRYQNQVPGWQDAHVHQHRHQRVRRLLC
jgi:hypothetical protein